MSIVLSFKDSSPAFDRAKATPWFMSTQQY